MKVAYLLGSLNRGGMETLLLDLFKRHAAVSYEMIGLYRKGGVCEEEFKTSGVPMEQHSPRFPFDPRYLRELRKRLIVQDIDVVHAQQWLDLLYAKIATYRTNIKCVQTFHGYDFNVKGLNRWLMQLSMKISDCNVFVSREQRSHYMQMYRLHSESKNRVVYNGIDFNKISFPTEKSTHNPILLGMVGNFVAGRNQMMVCEALALLKASGEQFEFQFVGGRSVALPERYDACVQFCKDHGLEDNVSFLGVRSDVPKLLAEWDGFVYATDHDTFGIAVVEAMAAGLPTFVNDWGVMREITHAGEWAHLYDTNNAQLLSSQLEGFISSSEKYRTYATEVANEVRKTYSIEQHAYALNTLYRELIFIKTEM